MTFCRRTRIIIAHTLTALTFPTGLMVVTNWYGDILIYGLALIFIPWLTYHSTQLTDLEKKINVEVDLIRQHAAAVQLQSTHSDMV